MNQILTNILQFGIWIPKHLLIQMLGQIDLKDMKRNWWKHYRQAIKFVHEYIQEKFEWNGRVEDEQAAFPFLLSDYDENWNENIDKHLLQMIYYTPKHYTSFRDEL